jgi:uncharacterized protein (DUF58 family)
MTEHALAPRQRAEQLAATLPPLLVAAERVASVVAQGVHGRRRVGIGETFWQYRRYQPGDAATRIDWRQSAKTAHLFIRENEWEAAESVWLWRDASPSMHYRSHLANTGKVERATLLLLALAVLLVRGSEHIALLGRGRRPSTGGAALNRLVAELERDAANEASLPPADALPRYSQVVLIGDFLTPVEEIDSLVRHYVGRGVKGHIMQVVDPAEESLPFTGRTRFEGFENEGEMLIGRPEALRDDYIARFAAHRATLADLARAAGWSFVTHHTDRPAQEALLAIYIAMSAQVSGR